MFRSFESAGYIKRAAKNSWRDRTNVGVWGRIPQPPEA